MALRTVTLKYTFDAPRYLVFRSFTDESLLAEWWGPKGFTNPVCEVDARPGGEMRIDMRDPNGVVYPMKGKFIEVSAPDKLVFTTSAFENEQGIPTLEDFNTVTLEEQDGRTHLLLVAEVTKAEALSEEGLSGMEDGWRESLERLEKTLEGCEDRLSPDAVFEADAGPREVRTTAYINASRSDVFQALTDPYLIAQWWGPSEYKTEVEHNDVRPGGSWRFIQSAHGVQEAFRGEYRQVNAPSRLVYTFEYEGMPGHIATETISLEEVAGKTKITDSLVFNTTEDRDGMVEAGMESGNLESYDRLANLWRKCYLEESAV